MRRTVSLLLPITSTTASTARKANDLAPSSVWPPIAYAANTSPPSARVKADTAHFGYLRGAVDMEDLLDAVVEVASERDRQGKRRGVALGLDGVDGLAGNAERLAEVPAPSRRAPRGQRPRHTPCRQCPRTSCRQPS